MPIDWNDLRYFLAVARAGTTLGGAKALGVNQTTCARRISALEHALGVPLFERGPGGYALTGAGVELAPEAERVEAAAGAFEARAVEALRASRRLVRLSTNEVLARAVATPALAALRERRPEIRVELLVDNRAANLLAGEADVALRAGFAPTQEGLVARRLADTPFGIYCSAAYAVRFGAPATLEDALTRPMAATNGKPAELLRAAKADLRFIADSMTSLCDLLLREDCVGGLPTIVGDHAPGLVCGCVLEMDSGGVWIVYPERLRGRAHLSAVVTSLVEAFDGWWRGRRSR